MHDLDHQAGPIPTLERPEKNAEVKGNSHPEHWGIDQTYRNLAPLGIHRQECPAGHHNQNAESGRLQELADLA
jgi:hypothetical protein